jgi:hypothetical protein
MYNWSLGLKSSLYNGPVEGVKERCTGRETTLGWMATYEGIGDLIGQVYS